MRVVRPSFAVEVRFLIARPFAGGSPDPFLGLTLFIEAQASINVPSTEKWAVNKLPHPGLRQHRA